MKRLKTALYYLGVFISALSLFSLYGALPAQAQEDPVQLPHTPVCIHKTTESVRCNARVVTDQKGQPQVTTVPQGYGPDQFQTAYNLQGLSSSGRIVAIIDAFDNPNINSDLTNYSTTFGLPNLPDCVGPINSSSVPCFSKVDQRGGTSYPTTNSSWALETALDVETVHAVCPDCKILLVEGDSNTYDNLMSSIDQAVAQGANVISNSYGSAEFSSENSLDSHFNVPGVAFTFSSGDSGYGTQYPAASKLVTAVGGTSLQLYSDNTYRNEVAWSGTGSGCSHYEAKPAWQTDKGCINRTIADVSADADPSTGAAIYDTVPYGATGQTGWFQVGGTSLASPIVAAVYALKGVPTGVQANSLPYLNNNSLNLHDVISGSNGNCNRRAKYLCTAGVGYDGPTGLGSPKGVNAF